MSQIDQELDRIERSISIQAGAETVWELVARPGWWINDGSVDPDMEVRSEGEYDVVVHDEYGEFRLKTIESDRPRYVSYRWVDPEYDSGTLVEFWIEEQQSGSVTLRVVESGFTYLGKSREDIVKHVEENTGGWETELEAAKQFVTTATQ